MKTDNTQLISYAQNAEDVMLWRALGHIERGFYIDVGAWWPDVDSVTRLFSDRGWHGINIEPNPEHSMKLAECRPGDINLTMAVGAHEGIVTMNFVKGGGSGLSTIREDYARLHEAAGWETESRTVSQTTLAKIWLDHVLPDQEVHFLKIDVEGQEKAVLEGNDWSQNRPWIVLLEATMPNTQIECYLEWEHILLAAGYLLAYRDGLNRFYVSQEREELLRSFKYPPNVFDKFITSETHRLRLNIQALNHDLECRTNELTAAHKQVTEHLARLKAEVKLAEDQAESARLRIQESQTTLTEERRRSEAVILGLLQRHYEIVAYRTPRGLARQMTRRLASIIKRALGRKSFWNEIEMIRLSILFDPQWYRTEYPDIATFHSDEPSHYYHSGASEGRDPGPFFSTRQYLEAHPEAAGMNPIIHYTVTRSNLPT